MLSVACDRAGQTGDDADGADPAPAPTEQVAAAPDPGPDATAPNSGSGSGRETGSDQDAASDTAGDPPAPATPAPAIVETPIEFREMGRASMIYAEPRFGSEYRGKHQRRTVLAVFEHVEGDPECEGDGWGRVGVSAYACLEHADVVKKKRPKALPRVSPGMLTPFHYARVPKNATVMPPRWASRAALRSGAEPIDTLEKEHDYAYVMRRFVSGHGPVYTDGSFRAVRERDVSPLRPSKYHGHDVRAHPLRDDAKPAWSVVWRYAAVREKPDEDAKEVGRVLHQQLVYIDDEPKGSGRYPWYPTADGRGWVWGKEVRKLDLLEPPAEVTDDQVWLDVDLDQQMMSVRRGESIEFVTLIASGSHKHPTPPGLYRITSKMAYSDMRSRPGDPADEAYYVEAVPWVMYFDGRYALHGTFWHNRFGNRTSHGCVNLSASDARRIFDLVEPKMPDGWISVYEHRDAPGTLLRVRKGLEHPEDRRDKLSPPA